MKVSIKTPNITQYHFKFEANDEIHWRCMWASINLDHDTFTMTATTDCGNYTHSWRPTDSETFVHLMARLEKEYLLDKISNRNRFDFEESKEEAIKMAKLYGDMDAGNFLQLQEMEHCSEEMYIREVAELTGWEYESIPVEKHYPPGAVTFCEVFVKYLQPILRENKNKAAQ